MPKSNGGGQYIMDCYALEFLSQTSSNIIRDTIIGMIQSGAIKIPQAVWDEFREVYEDEAAEIAAYDPQKIRAKPAHRAVTGVIASKANSGFRTEPYNNSDWNAAGVAEAEGWTLITVEAQCSFYEKLLTCPVIAITDLP
jgi:hypothetical protein